MADDQADAWTCSAQRQARANIRRYLDWLASRGHSFSGYHDLWQWSVDDVAGFWRSIWDYFEVMADGEIGEVVSRDPMPRTRWFTGTRLNFAEHVLRHELSGSPDRAMLHHGSELRPLAAASWGEIAGRVRRLATSLREMGIGKGDRVVAYMPNIPEAVTAMLATTAIGAVWSSAAPEFGAQTVIDRFSQIAPKLVFAVNGYRYGAKDFDRIGDLETILAALPSAEMLVMLDYHPAARKAPEFRGGIRAWPDLLDGPAIARDAFQFARVASDHPLWVLFTSGTTGLPKPIVHNHHGIVLEHYKSAAFHFEIEADGTLFFYSTTGWMVWNTLMWGPLMNGTSVLYDGHPSHPDARLVWRLVEAAGVTVLGISPSYIQLVRQQGVVPGREFNLERLQSVMLVGSPSTPEVFRWVHEAVKPEVWASSQSGGTEFCSGLLAGSPLLPTHAGEIQAPALGVAAVAFDDAGREIIDEAGELVVRAPMPSMPLCFWGDADFVRYTDSYFGVYPGVWRHGDRVRFNARGGCHVLGRSDATLNRHGVRIGSAEIYRTMEGIPGIVDSLVICIEQPDGGFYMPLFVQLAQGIELTDGLQDEIRRRLRHERSPRHVPDVIIGVPEIPMTLTGKKMEVPVRRLLLGDAPDKVASKDATRNPAALDWFTQFAAARRGG
ncbi:acetoacetate--CoA ligase [Bradyrhizobium oligotrophicum]|uniref:acetoacetate--CoA ligase n=1 Tax=Bradyrhizobium oligotrophicum TaxID=44255 RepID=UPI003EB8336E